MKIHHVAMKVSNVKQAAMFYQEFVGLPFISYQYRNEELYSAWLKFDGAILMLEKANSPVQPDQNNNVLALKVDVSNRVKLLQKCFEHNIVIEKESEYSFYFSDPDGNNLAFSHYPVKFS